MTQNNNIGKAELIWTTYQASIKRALYSYENQRESREDLAQEIFCAIVDAAQKIEQAENPKAYLFRIVHNVAVDHITQSVKHKADSVEPNTLGAIHEHSGQSHIDSPDTGLEVEQRQQALMRAVRSLSAPHRQIIILYLEELSSEEIAAILRIKSGAARTRINRAKLALKEKLQHVINA